MTGPEEPEAPLAETVHEASKDAHAALIFVVVMAVVQLVSVAMYTFNAAKDRDEERYEQTLNRQMKILTDIYDRQDKKYKEIEYPLISMRVTLNEIGKTCKEPNLSLTDKKNRLRTLKNQRLLDKTALIQAYGASQIVFGAELFKKLRALVSDLDETEVLTDDRLCALMTPNYELKIKEKNIEIEHLMFNSMVETEKKMNLIISKENF